MTDRLIVRRGYVRDIKEIAKIVTKHQTDLNFGADGGSQIQTPEIAITFYYRIVDGHTEFPHCTYAII